VVTPSPDPVNQCIFAAPMVLLYGLSIGVAWIFGKKKTVDI
jgi:sec-independent protein translocase protein TatC